MRRKFFKWHLSREIFDKIAPHLQAEKNHGYPFHTAAEMNAQTDAFNVKALLDDVDRQTKVLPTAYGEAFRHIMCRDLYGRLNDYAAEARRHMHPKCVDPRLLARRA
jgi:hypothetical protein